MTIPRRNLRNLQDIRTHSRAKVEVYEPHKAFMRLTCLEMEKARREKERESALKRIRNIEARFQEIEAEKAEILRDLAENGSVQALPPRSQDRGESRALQPSGEGFRFKY